MEKAPGLRACRRCLLAALLGCFMLNIQLTNANKKDSVRTSRQAPDPAEGVPLGGIWGPWGPWSSCTKSCGLGIAERRRTCLSPLPEPLQPWRDPHPPSRLGTPIQRGYGAVVSAERPPEYPPSHPLFMSSPENRQTVSRNPRPHHSPAANQGPVSIYRDAQDVAAFYRPDFPPANQERLPLYRQGSPLEEQRAGAPLNPPPAQEDTAWRLRPYQDGSANRGVGGGNRRSVSANQELRSSRRPPPHSSIQPGRYGYGKVPFALPLHRSSDRRSRRARHGKENETEGRGDPQSETEGRGDPQSETEGRGDPQSETEGRGDPRSETETASLLQRSRRRRRREEGSEAGVKVPERGEQGGGEPSRHSQDTQEPRQDRTRTRPKPRPGAAVSGASSVPVSGDTDRTRSQGGAPVEADQRASSTAPHRSAPRPPHWGSSPSSSSRGGYSHHRYSDPWLPHSRDPSNLFRGERGPLASSGLGPSAQSHANWELYRPASASPAYLCHGPQSEHKTCNLEACPGGAVDPRAAQCSGFDSQEFMGRRYEWEPFLEAGGGYQRCELNCRPVGFRFYVRHAERVWDGTPCQGNSSAVCITGRCLSPGCDGVLGSNLTLDSCGVCGGEGATCRRVAGTFQNSSVPIGYHQFLKIPPGATRITITERERSPNYLALRTGSGLSVINGRWAVDPPGQYEAGGTLFHYRRGGTGGEMLTAPGPTTTVLLVYIIFHKKNPGIDYEFYLPAERRRAEELEREQRERQGFSALTLLSSPGPLQTPLVAPPLREASPAPLSRGSARNVRIPPRTDLPPQSLPDFLWRRAGLTDCSASCGKGFQFPVFQCVSRKTQQEVEDRKCDPTAKPAPVEEACNVQPCPAFWEAGAWSGCSQSCGPGEQQRQVQCRQVYGAHSTMVHPQLCSSLLRPNSTQPCQLRVCSHWEIRSNWSSCSVMCGQGQRTRSVRCVSTHGAMVSEGECSAGLRPRGNEACNMGPCVRSWLSSDWSNTCSVECGTGVQRRSVVCLASRADGPSEQSCGGAKPEELRACSGGACQPSTRWYTGPWSECNVECGNGTQRRDIICVNKLGADFNVTPARDCAHLEKLPSVQECSAGPCRAKWYTTQWSACSRSCVGGVQAREVRCLTEDRALSQQCDPDLKPAEKQNCNTQPCTGETDENCRDTHHNCPLVVQARLCVYSYYRTVCCAACARGAERSKRQRERERERERDTPRETHRDTERQRDRERDTPRERETERHRETQRDTETQRDRQRERERERERETERERERHRDTKRHRETERDTDTLRDTATHRETQRHTERHSDTQRDTATH